MKKPFLIVLLVAFVVAGALMLSRADDDTYEYQGYRIPENQLRIADPHPGCEYTHYHAAEVDAVSATDGTVLIDTSDCGYGPVQ